MNLEHFGANISLQNVLKRYQNVYNLRETANNRNDKIYALEKQVEFLNSIQGDKLLQVPKDFVENFLNDKDLNNVWAATHINTGIKDKATILGDMRQVYKVYKYLDFVRPGSLKYKGGENIGADQVAQRGNIGQGAQQVDQQDEYVMSDGEFNSIAKDDIDKLPRPKKKAYWKKHRRKVMEQQMKVKPPKKGKQEIDDNDTTVTTQKNINEDLEEQKNDMLMHDELTKGQGKRQSEEHLDSNDEEQDDDLEDETSEEDSSGGGFDFPSLPIKNYAREKQAWNLNTADDWFDFQRAKYGGDIHDAIVNGHPPHDDNVPSHYGMEMSTFTGPNDNDDDRWDDDREGYGGYGNRNNTNDRNDRGYSGYRNRNNKNDRNNGGYSGYRNRSNDNFGYSNNWNSNNFDDMLSVHQQTFSLRDESNNGDFLNRLQSPYNQLREASIARNEQMMHDEQARLNEDLERRSISRMPKEKSKKKKKKRSKKTKNAVSQVPIDDFDIDQVPSDQPPQTGLASASKDLTNDKPDEDDDKPNDNSNDNSNDKSDDEYDFWQSREGMRLITTGESINERWGKILKSPYYAKINIEDEKSSNSQALTHTIATKNCLFA